MFDFSGERVFDNHTHLLNMKKTSSTPDEFLDNFYHGKRRSIAGIPGQICPESLAHLHNQGTVKTLVHLLSGYLGCEEDLDAVMEARNSLTATPEALKAYVENMYRDSGICASMLDSELPFGDPAVSCLPGKVLRLFQYETPMMDRIKTAASFAEARDGLLADVEQAHREGFAALKGHVGERFGFDLELIGENEAETAFQAAKEGDKKAMKVVYTAIFSDLLVLSRELDMPVNLHSGSTGMGKHNQVNSLDPSLMAPFLSSSKHIDTKIVFLHAGYPFVRQLGMLAYNFPCVYADLSQTLPWWGMAFSEIFRDMVAVAPQDKIILGSGQHGCPETSWIAAKIAKKVIAKVMQDLVGQELLSEKQAAACAGDILYGNAAKLYGLA